MKRSRFTSSRHAVMVAAVIFAAMLATWNGNAQLEGYNHPELDWFTIETEHFSVHFHKGTERTARMVAHIAEEVYEPVTSLYHFAPRGKVHFVIRDHDDYSNGATYYFDNKIEIWATAMDFDLRGTHPWLRDVVTHEFTHMVSLQAAMRFSRHVPAFFLQAFGYEDEKRPDVLLGYPNVLASYPIAGVVVPVWFAEGVAQYQAPGLEHDRWDSHRDMILRMATLDGKLLSYDAMGVFGKRGLGNEMAYNHGYALVRYIAEKYGPDKLERITKAMRSPLRLTLDSALKTTIGVDGAELYRQWRAQLESHYQEATQPIREHRVEGSAIYSEGDGNLHPVWSPDGTRLAFLSNVGRDYLSQTSLHVYSMEKHSAEAVVGGVSSCLSWTPDGHTLVYAKNERGEHSAHFNDLFAYDLHRKKEKRLTRGLRAHSPDISPDGQQIVCVINGDGTQNLALLDIRGQGFRLLTQFSKGEQVYHPRWSPDGTRIVFGYSASMGRDIAIINADGSGMRFLVNGPNDARDPAFSRDGKSIYFAWDRTGIFNIYALDLESLKTTQLTNVLGGAFMPSVNAVGDIAYSLFTSDGYKLVLLEKPSAIDESWGRYVAAGVVSEPQPAAPNLAEKPRDDDAQVPSFGVRSYSPQYTSISFLPRAVLDYGTVKLGTYLASSDMLDKMGFFAGFGINHRFDYDLFGVFEYRRFGPTLFLEAFNQTYHTSEAGIGYRYSLIEVDLGARFKPTDRQVVRAALIHSRYDAKLKFRERQQEIKFGYTYFLGWTASLRWSYMGFRRAVDEEINPVGQTISLTYERQWNKFIAGFTINSKYGTIQEVYTPYYYNQVGLEWSEYRSLPLKGHTLGLRVKSGFIDRPVDSFFYFFAGGLHGMKGYPYYSIEGRKLLTGNVTYRFPIARSMDFRFGPIYFGKLFAAAFFDYGNAFNGRPDLADFKSDAGLQLRLETFSFYAYPTRFFFDAAYGFNRFQTRGVTYGKEWHFYFGVAFGFLD